MNNKFLEYRFVQDSPTMSPTCREVVDQVIKNAKFFKGTDLIWVIINSENENAVGEINIFPSR